MVEISQLTEASAPALADVNRLLAQLRGEHHADVTLEQLRTIVHDGDSYVVVAREGERIVGVASLFAVQTLGKRLGLVEDVVVDETYRGKGLGAKLMEHIIATAREHRVAAIELTSRPAREAANKLYQKLGFERRETNVYRMKL